jgi:hypothetical protein
MRELGIRNARQVARDLLRRFGVRAAEHVCIESFAKRLGATIVVGPLDGATAQLVRIGKKIKIIVSDRITDEAARRFSIAHELGHLVLDHPTRPPSELCTNAPSLRGAKEERDYEAEANAFAGELLIPHFIVQSWCDVSPVNMDVPWRISRELRVSILASAIQFAALSPERCAAVFSKKRHVSWVAPSPTFTREIRRGRRIDPESLAWDFFERGVIDARAQPVPADAWIETSTEVEIVEHSIAARDHGTVLSLLWIPERAAWKLGM